MNSTGEQLKEAGQAAVLSNVSEAWRDAALEALEAMAKAQKRLTADDFREFARKRKVGDPHHSGAWGGIFTAGSKNGWIRKTNKREKSLNPASHAHEYVVWESLLLPDDTALADGEHVEWVLKVPGKSSRGFSTADKALSSIDAYAESVKAKRDQVKFYKAICVQQPI